MRNATVGAPTATLNTRHGSISATFRVVGDSIPATATIQSTTRSGNIVLELVSPICHPSTLSPPDFMV